MSVSDLESTFPNLVSTGYRVTSVETIDYNCLAWVTGDNLRWWQPEDGTPSGVPYFWHVEGRSSSIDTFVEQYATLGFELAEDGNFEADFEKIALYANAQSEPTHMALQLSETTWSSKCGDWEDIEHTLGGLESDLYGTVSLFMKRRRAV